MKKKVFISWSGKASQAVASEISEYLQLLVPGIETFMSRHDIDSGTRWTQRIAEELEATSFGILCLTPGNLESPWLHFEAGALTKQLDAGRACSLLFHDLEKSAVTGPLSQFQNCCFNKEEFRELIAGINSARDETAVAPADKLQKFFTKFWPDLQKAISAAIKENPIGESKKTDPRSDREILEECLLRIRSIDRGREEPRWSALSSLASTSHRPSPEDASAILVDLSDAQLAVLREMRKNGGTISIVRAHVVCSPFEVDKLYDARVVLIVGDPPHSLKFATANWLKYVSRHLALIDGDSPQ